MNKMILGLATAATVVFASSLANAQAVCNERTKVLRHLSERYKEAPVGMGLASNGAVLEVLSSKEGSSWTIIATQPNGVSCVLAAGESWQPIEHVALNNDRQQSY